MAVVYTVKNSFGEVVRLLEDVSGKREFRFAVSVDDVVKCRSDSMRGAYHEYNILAR